MSVDFETARQMLLALPSVEEKMSYYQTPAFHVRKKFLARLHEKEDNALVLMVGEVEQEILLQIDPAVYYITDHYRGSGALLVRLAAIDPADLQEALEKAWRRIALKRDLAVYDSR